MILLAVGLSTLYIGLKTHRIVKIGRPGRFVTVTMVLTWAISLLVLLFVEALLKSIPRQQQAQPPNPITPITVASGVCTFFIIAFLTRGSGFRVALLSAFVGTAAAPMIFELPLDLTVIWRVNAPAYFTLLFFLPLFLVEIATMALLSLSSLTGLTRYSLFALAGMFIVFAIWAVFGFAYPSDPVSYTLNVISKLLCFATAILLYVDPAKVHRPKARAP